MFRFPTLHQKSARRRLLPVRAGRRRPNLGSLRTDSRRAPTARASPSGRSTRRAWRRCSPHRTPRRRGARRRDERGEGRRRRRLKRRGRAGVGVGKAGGSGVRLNFRQQTDTSHHLERGEAPRAVGAALVCGAWVMCARRRSALVIDENFVAVNVLLHSSTPADSTAARRRGLTCPCACRRRRLRLRGRVAALPPLGSEPPPAGAGTICGAGRGRSGRLSGRSAASRRAS